MDALPKKSVPEGSLQLTEAKQVAGLTPKPLPPAIPKAPLPVSRPLIVLPESDEDLLEECDIETFRSGGKGGQHVNKTDSAVRLRHLPTGIVAQCQDERSQFRNKQIACERLREKVAELNLRQKQRVATRKPRSAKRATRKEKSHRSGVKQARSQKNWNNGDD